ncbi:MAG: hypothetical protein ACO395_09435, partial [Pontimonas sp.]
MHSRVTMGEAYVEEPIKLLSNVNIKLGNIRRYAGVNARDASLTARADEPPRPFKMIPCCGEIVIVVKEVGCDTDRR